MYCENDTPQLTLLQRTAIKTPKAPTLILDRRCCNILNVDVILSIINLDDPKQLGYQRSNHETRAAILALNPL